LLAPPILFLYKRFLGFIVPLHRTYLLWATSVAYFSSGHHSFPRSRRLPRRRPKKNLILLEKLGVVEGGVADNELR